MLKRPLKSLLGTLGYVVLRAENVAPETWPVDADEVRELEALLRRHAAEDADPKWADYDELRTYLFDKRICFFHDLVDQCCRRGVPFEGRTVADVGTGTGYLLRVIGTRFPDARLTGFDQIEGLVRVARRLWPDASLGRVDFLREDPPETYDVVFCTEVLEHLIDPGRALRRLLAWLRPGGALVLTVPDGRTDAHPAHELYENGLGHMGHINFWSPESWRHFIARNVAERPFETGSVATGENLAIIRQPA